MSFAESRAIAFAAPCVIAFAGPVGFHLQQTLRDFICRRQLVPIRAALIALVMGYRT